MKSRPRPQVKPYGFLYLPGLFTATIDGAPYWRWIWWEPVEQSRTEYGWFVEQRYIHAGVTWRRFVHV